MLVIHSLYVTSSHALLGSRLVTVLAMFIDLFIDLYTEFVVIDLYADFVFIDLDLSCAFLYR